MKYGKESSKYEKFSKESNKEYYTRVKPETEEEVPKLDLEKGWYSIPVSGAIGTSPAIYDNTIFFGACDKYFYAVDAKTGELKWKFLTGDIIVSSPAIYDNIVYFGSFDNCLYALSAKDGKLLWKFRTDNKIICSPTVVEDVVYFNSADSNFYALAYKTGELLWKFNNSGVVASEVAIVNNMALSGSADNSIYALDIENGKVIWRFRPFGEVNASTIAISDKGNSIFDFMHRSHRKMPFAENGTAYFGNCRDSNLYALNLGGSKKWAFLASAKVGGSPSIYDGVIYVGADDNYIYAISENKDLYWKFRTGGIVWSRPLVDKETVYFGSFDSYLYALGIDGRILWKLYTGDMVVSSPVVNNDILYFGSGDTFLYALDIKRNEILWKFQTGYPTKLTDFESVRKIINELKDYNRRIYKVWKPETVAGKTEMVSSAYEMSGPLDIPITEYGVKSPYRTRPTYKTESEYR